jgi:glycosyltransferase involved in cell wall biosynthesis
MENINSTNLVFFILPFIHLLLLAVVVSNYFYLSKTHSIPISKNYQPKLDIFIPARNEETNIQNVINSILQSDYKNYKIFVLDDNSTDNTNRVVKELIKNNRNIELINGKPLPENWIGKNWACHQLSQKSESEFKLFIDADVTLDRKAISFAINIMQKREADLLSIFPSQKIKNLGEQLVVPIMDWILLTFLPLSRVFYSNKKSLSAANGQFMLFRAQAYKQFGGHKTIKNKIVEDIEVARGFKALNKRVVTLSGNNLVQCHMYNGFFESVNGFTKNFYSGINANSFVFSLLLLVVFFLFVFPFIWLVSFKMALLIIVLILIQRILSSIISKQSIIINLILFPVHILVMIYIAVRSLILTKSKRLVWKVRTIN